MSLQGTGDYAAYVCATCVAGGYTDWFLPSGDELNYMYTNLKVNGLGGFADAEYWSSTECTQAVAFEIRFSDGATFNSIKGPGYHVRAARAF
jgi:hypothetical protein